LKIAISGMSGCGNSTVSGLVGEKLGLTVINYTKRNLAEEAKMPFDEWYARHGNDKKYDFMLESKQIELAGENTVTGTRLACACIEADLKVWLHASPKTRAKRIAERENKDPAEVLKAVKERDKNDAKHYKAIYRIDIKKHEEFVDLVINTERYSAEEVVEIICGASKTLPSKPNRKAQRISRRIREIIMKSGE